MKSFMHLDLTKPIQTDLYYKRVTQRDPSLRRMFDFEKSAVACTFSRTFHKINYHHD